jgi:sigma-B regulation protein RsbU (phosphoserine phosphatase)
MMGDGRRFFFHLDVSGHGIPAALRSFSLHHRLSPSSPGDARALTALVEQLNAEAQDDAEGAYFTLVCGAISADGGGVDLVRAGHPMPILVHGGTPRFIAEGNPPVGLLPRLRYASVQVHLAPGDRLVVYSDGVTDCENRAGEAFGEARLADFLAANAARDLSECVAALERLLSEFRGVHGFEDDISMLMIERSHRGGDET